MGLRINTNLATLTAQRVLNINNRNQATSLERLSTGLRINRGADDPSGMIVSDHLRSQISGLKQAVENSQNAANMVSVADQALQQVTDLLTQIQDSIVFALNTGASTPDQIAAEQQVVDNAIQAVDRISVTTRYADRPLLNGNMDYVLVGDRPDGIDDLKVRRISFPDDTLTKTFTVDIVRNAQRAQITLTGASSVAGALLRLQGGRGTTDVRIGSGTVASGIARAINGVAQFTGIFASTVAGSQDVTIYSEDFGQSQLIRVEIVEGQVNGTANPLDDAGGWSGAEVGPFTVGEILSDRGLDAQVSFEGELFSAKGREFYISNRTSTFEFKLDPELVPFTLPQTITFDVGNTGIGFQLNELARPTDRLELGIEGVSSAVLGLESYRDNIEEAVQGGLSPSAVTTPLLAGGFLSSLTTGDANDLTNSPKNAQIIIKEAINQVGKLRAHLGAAVAFNIIPNVDQLNVEIENISSALSDIRDVDFAEEAANFSRNQVLFQAGMGVLAQANAIPQSVLTLLRQG